MGVVQGKKGDVLLIFPSQRLASRSEFHLPVSSVSASSRKAHHRSLLSHRALTVHHITVGCVQHLRITSLSFFFFKSAVKKAPAVAPVRSVKDPLSWFVSYVFQVHAREALDHLRALFTALNPPLPVGSLQPVKTLLSSQQQRESLSTLLIIHLLVNFALFSQQPLSRSAEILQMVRKWSFTKIDRMSRNIRECVFSGAGPARAC